MDLDKDLVRPVAQRDVHRGVVAVQAHVGLEKGERVVVVVFVVFIIKRKFMQCCGPDCLATNDIILYCIIMTKLKVQAGKFCSSQERKIFVCMSQTFFCLKIEF